MPPSLSRSGFKGQLKSPPMKTLSLLVILNSDKTRCRFSKNLSEQAALNEKKEAASLQHTNKKYPRSRKPSKVNI